MQKEKWNCPKITTIDIKRTLANVTGAYADATSGFTNINPG
jgi:hypothetical protein